jgi:hypothetical protein
MSELRYRSVYRNIKNGIISGEFMLGECLPTEPDFAKRYSVSVGTLRKSIGLLVREGLVERRQGSGTFVLGKATDAKPQKPFWVANIFALRFQEDINAALWGWLPETETIRTAPHLDHHDGISGNAWHSSSCVQISTLQLHLPGIEELFIPAPRNLAARIRQSLDARFANECCSRAGELLLIPQVINPAGCYVHLPAFERAGIRVPENGWDWELFIDTCRRLKKETPFPFLLNPYVGSSFDIFLWQHGGDFYDEIGGVSFAKEPFLQLMQKLRLLAGEGLCADSNQLPTGYQEFLQQKKSAITIMVPQLTRVLGEDAREWTFVPLPHADEKAGAVAVIGYGVPRECPDPERGWGLLEKVFFGKGQQRLTREAYNVFPARKDCQESWQGGLVGNPQCLRDTLSISRPLPSRKMFFKYYRELYPLLERTVFDDSDLTEVWSVCRKILLDNQYSEKAAVFF